MGFIDLIFSIVWDIQGFFFGLYHDSKDIPIVGHYISGWFYNVHRAFFALLTPITHFYDWAYDVKNKLQDVISLENVWDAYRLFFIWADFAWSWVKDATLNVLDVIVEWWSATLLDVINLINTATFNFQTLLNNLSNLLSNLQSSWDNFLTLTLPNLATWMGIQSMIDTTFRTWFPFYDELVSLWEEIKEFFVDPEDYIYKRLDSFFERYW